MDDLNTIKQLVKSILETQPKARDSDKFLIWLIFKEYTKSNISFEQFSLCPNFESIRRMRQKLQEENQELRGDELIQELREKKREEYSRFFGKKDNLDKVIICNGKTGVGMSTVSVNIERRVRGIEVENKIRKGVALF